MKPHVQKNKDRHGLKSALRIVSSVALAVAVALAVLIAVGLPGTVFLTLKSGSMEPALRTGTIIAVRRMDAYAEGDIITFRGRNGTRTTHRVVGMAEDNYLWTKGDANDGRDQYPVPFSEVVGKVVFTLPLAGYLADFVRSVPGFILFILLPAAFILVDEVRNLAASIRGGKPSSVDQKAKLMMLLLLGGAAWFVWSASLASTQSYYASNSRVDHSITLADYSLNAYLRQDGNAVGFVLDNVSDIVRVEYMLTYTKSTGQEAGVEGVIKHSGQSDVIRKEWLELGTCSKGVCVYDTPVTDLNFTATLVRSDGSSFALETSLDK